MIGFSAEQFSGTYVPSEQRGSSLSYSAATQTYTYKTADGLTAYFTKALSTGPRYPAGLSSIVKPDGTVITYKYKTVPDCRETDEGTTVCTNTYRLNAIDSSAGYRIRFNYTSGGVLLSVVGLNTATYYCDPTLDSCASIPANAPRLIYTNSADWLSRTITNEKGEWITATTNGMGQLQTVASSGFPTITYGYPTTTASSPTSISSAGRTWLYNYNFTTGTTVVTDPLLHQTTIQTNGFGITSETDPLSHVTSRTYDASGRLSTVTFPEGNSVQYGYDTRGNVTLVTHVAKAGSGLANIVTSAGYDTTCANPVTCNQPNWTRDALGAQTDYTYDATHGGVLTVTAPAPTAGAVRPQGRFSYAQVPTYGLNSASALVQIGTIWASTEARPARPALRAPGRPRRARRPSRGQAPPICCRFRRPRPTGSARWRPRPASPMTISAPC